MPECYKPCVECVHFRDTVYRVQADNLPPKCANMKVAREDVVRGYKLEDPYDARNAMGRCGPEGLFFERKPLFERSDRPHWFWRMFVGHP